MVRRSDEGCSATQKLDFLRSRQVFVSNSGSGNKQILDAGSWILDGIRNCFSISLICRKGPDNRLMMFPGKVEEKLFIPAKDGIFDQHRASSNQHRFASSKELPFSSTRRFEAKLR